MFRLFALFPGRYVMPIFPNWPGLRQADAARTWVRGYRGISVTAILASTLLSMASFSAGARADAAISAAITPITATRHAHARKHAPAKRHQAAVNHHHAATKRHRTGPKQHHAAVEHRRTATTHHARTKSYAPAKRHRAAAKHHRAPAKRHAKPPSALALARRGQWSLRIPSIDVATKLLVLGDPHGGQLPVPTLAQARAAAWYPFTAVPGAPGNAVIVGHVDTYTGPGVFYDLYLLRPGDKIYVRIGSRQEDFKVASVTEVPKTLLPVSKIFGGTRSRRLWLITCGGDFDYTTRHYLDNILVSSNLIGESHLGEVVQTQHPNVSQRIKRGEK